MTDKIEIPITQKIIQIKRGMAMDIFVLGSLLKKVRDEEIYKQESYDSFESYLAMPELAFNRATAYKFIKIFEVFGGNGDLLDIESDKLYLITGVVEKNPEDLDRWISRARDLSRSDLRDVIRELKGKPPKHSLSIHDKIKDFFEQTQLDQYIPFKNVSDKKFKEYEKCFKKLIIDYLEWIKK